MKLVPMRLLAGAIGLVAVTAGLPGAATASGGPLTPSPGTVQTIGVDYSGFSCPLQPVHAVAGVNTTLALTTTTNFGTRTTFSIPALNISVPLPFTLGSVRNYVNLGSLRRGTIPYEIDAPPVTGSYGHSCRGAFQVGLTPVTS